MCRVSASTLSFYKSIIFDNSAIENYLNLRKIFDKKKCIFEQFLKFLTSKISNFSLKKTPQFH
jgi:hypothetical protein